MSEVKCGISHYMGCECHEAKWAEKLAQSSGGSIESMPVVPMESWEAKFAGRIYGLESKLAQAERDLAGYRAARECVDANHAEEIRALRAERDEVITKLAASGEQVTRLKKDLGFWNRYQADTARALSSHPILRDAELIEKLEKAERERDELNEESIVLEHAVLKIGADRDELRARVERLSGALEKIAKLDTMTLLCDPADFDFNAEDAYEAGATNAFCDAAEIARDALGAVK